MPCFLIDALLQHSPALQMRVCVNLIEAGKGLQETVDEKTKGVDYWARDCEKPGDH